MVLLTRPNGLPSSKEASTETAPGSNSHRASNLENSLQAFFFENPLKSVEAGRPCRRTLEQIWAISTFSIIRNFKELADQSPIDFITQKVLHPWFLD